MAKKKQREVDVDSDKLRKLYREQREPGPDKKPRMVRVQGGYVMHPDDRVHERVIENKEEPDEIHGDVVDFDEIVSRHCMN